MDQNSPIENEQVGAQIKAAADPDPLIGAILDDKYEITAALSEGAMGKVYRAKHLELARDVAIKTMHSHMLISEESLARFRRESVLAGSLNHPNVIKVYSSGVTSNGQPYLAMDLLTGFSLSEALSNGGFTGERFLRLFEQILSGLKHAHSAGIVHRDIKPSNIFLTTENGEERPVIIDFGIAKATSENNQKVTQTGAVIGSSTYMSPEQCLGTGADERSDIYSLGCVMYECLAGQPPFHGDSALDVMYKHLHHSISQLGSLSKFPQAIANMILKCLAKDPKERYQNVAALEQDFLRCKSADTVQPERKNRIAALAAISILLLAGFLAALIWQQSHPVQTTSAAVTPTPPLTLPHSGRGMADFVKEKSSKIPQSELIALERRWLEENKSNSRISNLDRAKVQFLLCQVLLNAGEFTEADLLISEAIKNSAADKETRLDYRKARAHQRQQTGRGSEAVEERLDVLSEIAAIPVDEYGHHTPRITDIQRQVLCGLGESMCQLKDYPSALKYFQQAEQLLKSDDLWGGSASIECRRGLARCLFGIGRSQDGLKAMREAISVTERFAPEGEYITAQRLNAYTLTTAGYVDEGLALWKSHCLPLLQAPTLWREQVSLYTEMARACLSVGRYKESEAYGLQALDLAKQYNNGDLNSLFNNAVVTLYEGYARARNFAGGAALSDRIFTAVAQKKATPLAARLAWNGYVDYMEHSGRAGEVEEFLTKHRSLDTSTNGQLWWHRILAEFLQRNGEYKKAREIYAQGIKYGDTHNADDESTNHYMADLLLLHAQSELRTGQPAAGIGLLKRAWKLTELPGSQLTQRVQILITLADCQSQTGDLEGLKSSVKQIDALCGPNPPLEYCLNILGLSWSLCRVKQFDEAEKMIESVVSSCKKNQSAAPRDALFIGLEAKRNLAVMYMCREKDKEAQKVLEEEAAEWKTFPGKPPAQEISQTYLNLADLALKRNDLNAARSWTKLALERLMPEADISKLDKAAIVIRLADISRKTNDTKQADELFKQAYELTDLSEAGKAHRLSLVIPWALLLADSNPAQSEKLYGEGAQLAEQLGKKSEQEYCLGSQAAQLTKLGQTEEQADVETRLEKLKKSS